MRRSTTTTTTTLTIARSTGMRVLPWTLGLLLGACGGTPEETAGTGATETSDDTETAGTTGETETTGETAGTTGETAGTTGETETETGEAPVAPEIVGPWVSGCVAMGGGQAFSLDFMITAAAWSLDYAVFGDEACAVPFLTVTIDGPWAFENPSETVEGAWEAIFEFTEKTVTPHMEAAAEFLASDGGCGRDGFADGVATSIYDEGCAGLGQYPKAECAADYDLVAVIDGALYFGARPEDNNMCTPEARPEALSGLALTPP